jgi:hypothetical protein
MRPRCTTQFSFYKRSLVDKRKRRRPRTGTFHHFVTLRWLGGGVHFAVCELEGNIVVTAHDRGCRNERCRRVRWLAPRQEGQHSSAGFVQNALRLRYISCRALPKTQISMTATVQMPSAALFVSNRWRADRLASIRKTCRLTVPLVQNRKMIDVPFRMGDDRRISRVSASKSACGIFV